uniref:Jupiter microtubule associated homolog 1b n=1 Tax=Electrophorus electricus TaxID=8005 RepID=A0A4W4DRK2_ELEEL
MTTTTTFQGMDPSAKNSSRVLRPPGGASNICFGTDEDKPARKNRMASNIFAEPDDPHAHRRNNPPGGEASGVLCGEHSAPLRRCHQPPIFLNDSASTEHQSNPVVSARTSDRGAVENRRTVFYSRSHGQLFASDVFLCVCGFVF